MRNRIACKTWIFLWLIIFSISCDKSSIKNHRTNLSFYHWKTNWNPTVLENNYLKALQIQKIYLRFFDVDWDVGEQKAIPLAVLQSTDSIKYGRTIIPTIFITNRTFLNISDKENKELVNQVYQKIKRMMDENLIHSIGEIQIDCDWSSKTKAKYFDFLNQLRKQIKKEKINLSTTIRLHQIKYFKRTGVPPVDHAVLMFYNMGTLNKWESSNSILDLSIAKEYLTNAKKYPLKLDIALPLFSWTVLFRDMKMIKLINQLDRQQLEDATRFYKIKENRYKVVKSTYLNGYYLYEDDLLRVESIEQEQLEKSIQLFQQYMDVSDVDLIFYHLDTTIIKDTPYESLELLRTKLSEK